MYTVYGKQGCTFCEKAEDLLNQLGLEYEYKELGVDILAADFKRMFVENYNQVVTTVPQILHEGDYVGGYTELKETLNKETTNSDNGAVLDANQ